MYCSDPRYVCHHEKDVIWHVELKCIRYLDKRGSLYLFQSSVPRRLRGTGPP